MSKKNKKVAKQKFFEDEVPKKGQVKSLEDFLEKNQMDHTQFLCFVQDDFQNSYQLKQSLRQNLQVYEQILADYKQLLILPFNNFWSTLKFNSHIYKSLESFLKFSKQIIHFPEEFQQNFFLQEIYRVVFLIYTRMISSYQQDYQKAVNFQTFLILYEQWLIDIPKMFDLIEIYGNNNKQQVQYIIQKVFQEMPEYKADFQDAIEKTYQKILQQILNKLVDINNRAKFEDQTRKEDVDNKMNIAALINNIINSLNQCFDYFPDQCIEQIVIHDKLSTFFDEIFFHLDMAKKVWYVEEFEAQVNQYLSRIQSKIIKLILNCFQFIQSGLQNNKITEKNSKLYLNKLNQFVRIYSVSGQGKNAEKTQKILTNLTKNFDFQYFFQNLPQYMQNIDQENLQMFLIRIDSIQEFLKRRQNQDLYLNDETNEENIEDEENKENEDNENENEEKIQDLDLQKEAQIRYTEVYRKKDGEFKNLEATKEEKIQLAKQIKIIMNKQDEYEDEFDDTNDIYNKKLGVDRELDESSGSESEDDIQRYSQSQIDYEDEPEVDIRYLKKNQKYENKQKANQQENQKNAAENQKNSQENQVENSNQKKKSNYNEKEQQDDKEEKKKQEKIQVSGVQWSDDMPIARKQKVYTVKKSSEDKIQEDGNKEEQNNDQKNQDQQNKKKMKEEEEMKKKQENQQKIQQQKEQEIQKQKELEMNLKYENQQTSGENQQNNTQNKQKKYNKKQQENYDDEFEDDQKNSEQQNNDNAEIQGGFIKKKEFTRKGYDNQYQSNQQYKKGHYHQNKGSYKQYDNRQQSGNWKEQDSDYNTRGYDNKRHSYNNNKYDRYENENKQYQKQYQEKRTYGDQQYNNKYYEKKYEQTNNDQRETYVYEEKVDNNKEYDNNYKEKYNSDQKGGNYSKKGQHRGKPRGKGQKQYY